MQESAFLLKGLTIDVYDLEDNRENHFCYLDGIKEFVKYLNEDKNALLMLFISRVIKI